MFNVTQFNLVSSMINILSGTCTCTGSNDRIIMIACSHMYSLTHRGHLSVNQSFHAQNNRHADYCIKKMDTSKRCKIFQRSKLLGIGRGEKNTHKKTLYIHRNFLAYRLFRHIYVPLKWRKSAYTVESLIKDHSKNQQNVVAKVGGLWPGIHLHGNMKSIL